MTVEPKCPKCEKAIDDFAVRHMIMHPKAGAAPAAVLPVERPADAVVASKEAAGLGFYAAVVCCPHCATIISVVAEPNAIAADVVRRLRLPPAQAARQGAPQSPEKDRVE